MINGNKNSKEYNDWLLKMKCDRIKSEVSEEEIIEKLDDLDPSDANDVQSFMLKSYGYKFERDNLFKPRTYNYYVERDLNRFNRLIGSTVNLTALIKSSFHLKSSRDTIRNLNSMFYQKGGERINKFFTVIRAVDSIGNNIGMSDDEKQRTIEECMTTNLQYADYPLYEVIEALVLHNRVKKVEPMKKGVRVALYVKHGRVSRTAGRIYKFKYTNRGNT